MTNRDVIKQLVQLYKVSQLGNKTLAYDGMKGIFTARPLPFVSKEFVVKLGERDGRDGSSGSKSAWVSITPEVSKWTNRDVIEQLVQLYKVSQLGNITLAYDGMKGIFTAGPLPFVSKEFVVKLGEMDGRDGSSGSKSFKRTNRDVIKQLVQLYKVSQLGNQTLAYDGMKGIYKARPLPFVSKEFVVKLGERDGRDESSGSKRYFRIRVSITPEVSKRTNRDVIKQLVQLYKVSQLGNITLAYDGMKGIFTAGPLPFVSKEFVVKLGERDGRDGSSGSKRYFRMRVSITPEVSKRTNRDVIKQLVQLYKVSQLGNITLAYDGMKGIFTAGPLPFVSKEFVVKLGERDGRDGSSGSKRYFRMRVSITPEVSKRTNRDVIKQLVQLYKVSQLGNKTLAYDGMKGIFTARPLPFVCKEFVVKLGERDGRDGSSGSKRYFRIRVSITPEVSKWTNRDVIEQLVQLYKVSQLGNITLADDGMKGIFTAGPLPFVSKEFVVKLGEMDGRDGSSGSKSFKRTNRDVIKQLVQLYKVSQLGNQTLAYDGMKGIYKARPLPFVSKEFVVKLGERDGRDESSGSKRYFRIRVSINPEVSKRTNRDVIKQLVQLYKVSQLGNITLAYDGMKGIFTAGPLPFVSKEFVVKLGERDGRDGSSGSKRYFRMRVSITPEVSKRTNRDVIKQLVQLYKVSQLGNITLAYDGMKGIFTAGPLPFVSKEFVVKLGERDGRDGSSGSKRYFRMRVSITPEVSKRTNRDVIKQLVQLYKVSQLGNKTLAYDGMKGIFTARPLPFVSKEFVVKLGERDGRDGSSGSKRLFFVICFVVTGEVSITPEVSKRTNRDMIKQLVQLYKVSHLVNRTLAYDGMKGIFTAGSLPFVSKEFVVKLGERDGRDGSSGSKRKDREFKVVVKLADKPDLHRLPQEAIQVLNVVLRAAPSDKYYSPFVRKSI
ncbi:unnamed protein product [Prunus armeniaca]